MTTGMPGQDPNFTQWPTQQPSTKRRWLPWVIVAVVLVIGLIIAAILFFTEDDKPTPSTAPSTSQTVPSSSETSAPAVPGAPVPCGQGLSASNLCIPDLTMDQAEQKMKSMGATCERSRSRLSCEFKQNEDLSTSIAFNPDFNNTSVIRSIAFSGSAGGDGDYPEGEQKSIELLKEVLAKGMPVLFPQPPGFVEQARDWANTKIGKCSRDIMATDPVGGYQLKCDNPEAIGGTGPAGSFNIWSTSVTVEGGNTRPK